MAYIRLYIIIRLAAASVHLAKEAEKEHIFGKRLADTIGDPIAVYRKNSK